MSSILPLLIIFAIGIHLGLLVIARLRFKLEGVLAQGLFITTLLCVVAIGTYLLPQDFIIADRFSRIFFTTLAFSAAFIAFGDIILKDTLQSAQKSSQGRWLILGALWLTVIIVGGIIDPNPLLPPVSWLDALFATPSISLWAILVGATILSAILTGISFYRFYKARLPEVANRALFWVMASAPMLFALIAASGGSDNLAGLSILFSLVSVISTLYALTKHRLFDIRTSLLITLRILTVLAIGASLTLGALYLAVWGGLQANPEGIVIMGVLALIVAMLYIPLSQLAQWVIEKITARNLQDNAKITREYSHLVAEMVELESLIPSTTTTLMELLRVRGCCLILLSNTSIDAIDLLVRQHNSPNDHKTGKISLNSPLYLILAKDRQPITQFDIEFAPEYRNIPAHERQFFREIQMSAYAPVTLDQTLIGILGFGPKINDTAFMPSDMVLLSTLAQQTGIALRNARLVEDLQHLNKSMRSLNSTLKNANEQLERMDAVKTDFVTIASHELRTPLAQIRGYTDIIDALNEQGMLDQDQTATLVGNLRKATERMEELISAMLDVSQLDVDAMDLRFTQTSPEALIKMAIEPLTDAIKQRKLTLSARGLRGLPTFPADLQRLVQAFRNVIVNSIKFTPDSGRIDIVASLQSASSDDDVDRVLIQIRDTGVGIDKKNLEMIFKKFFRAYDPSLHSTGAYKFLGAGPGLGLTIARGVIEGHGGKIWAESEAHSMETFPGATFNILLPVTIQEGTKRVLSFEGPVAEKAVQTSEMTKVPKTAPLTESVTDIDADTNMIDK
ncbi:MAG: HAMP domain-containing sensor histidine kinase [Phototrophicales bacterium]|nr:HAMP domain-containing sensor histidine kinase [Phototrophicales bacterium]